MSDLRLGTLVRFAHEKDGGPVHRVVSVMRDSMVEIHDMGGYFAPHLFVVADNVGDIPPSCNDGELLPCPFCGNDKCTVIWELYSTKVFCSVQCELCTAEGPLADDEKAAAEAWNRRNG